MEKRRKGSFEGLTLAKENRPRRWEKGQGRCLHSEAEALLAAARVSAARQAGRDGSPDNLPCEETTGPKPQDLTTHKQEVRRQSRPALRGTRAGGMPGYKGGKLSPQPDRMGPKTIGVQGPKC